MENQAIPDTSFFYKKSVVSPDALSPRLSSSRALCFDSISDVYFKVSLRSVYFICALGTQGHSERDWYVKAYKIELATLYSKGDYYMENGSIKVCVFWYNSILFNEWLKREFGTEC